MKKLLALTIVAGSAIGMATACGGAAVSQETNTNNSNTGEAIGLVHGTITGTATTAYLGLASVTTKDGKIASVRIEETINKTYGTTANGAGLKDGMTDIKGKDAAWAYGQLAGSYSYKLKSYTFTQDVCYTVSSLTYTGVEAADTAACTTAKGTWLAAGTALAFEKTGAALAAGKYADGTAYVVADATLVETTKNDGVNSKMASQGTAYGYWDPANRTSIIKGWAWNMKQIENSFVGLTWAQIESKDFGLATDVTGATASDRHQYAQVVKAAAKVAFGK